MLFDDDLPDDVVSGLKALESAADLGVPWPFDPEKDLALLRRVKDKYPERDVAAAVESLLAWMMDELPWTKQKTVRWRSRLWTWMVNDERYERSRARGSAARPGGTHHVASGRGHGADTEALDRW